VVKIKELDEFCLDTQYLQAELFTSKYENDDVQKDLIRFDDYLKTYLVKMREDDSKLQNLLMNQSSNIDED